MPLGRQMGVFPMIQEFEIWRWGQEGGLAWQFYFHFAQSIFTPAPSIPRGRCQHMPIFYHHHLLQPSNGPIRAKQMLDALLWLDDKSKASLAPGCCTVQCKHMNVCTQTVQLNIGPSKVCAHSFWKYIQKQFFTYSQWLKQAGVFARWANLDFLFSFTLVLPRNKISCVKHYNANIK